MKKALVIVGILFIILLVMIGYDQYTFKQTYTSPFGEAFGYFFYVIVAAGVIGVIWLLLKPAKKKD